LHPSPGDAIPILEELRKHWKRLIEGVRRRPAAPTRNDQILAGGITPPKLTAESLRELREYFEAVFVSQVLEEQVDGRERLFALADQFGGSTVSSDRTRALLWSAAAHSLSALQLREELRSLARPLSAVSEPERERHWWDAVCRLIYALPQPADAQPEDRATIQDLSALVSAADDSDQSDVAFLAGWATRESPAPRKSVPPGSVAPSGEKATPTPSGVASTNAPPALEGKERALVDSWVLQQRGFTPNDATQLRSDLERIREEAGDVAAHLNGVDGWIRAPRLAQQMRDVLERFVLPFAAETAEVWRQVLEQSERAFQLAAGQVGKAALGSVITRRAIAAMELEAAAKLFERRPLWQHLPSWWWQQLRRELLGQEDSTAAAPGDGDFIELFCIAQVRNLTVAACERLRALEPSLLPSVALLTAPPDGTGADEHLAAELEHLGRVLGHARQKYQTSLTRLLDGHDLSPRHFADLADVLDKLDCRVSPGAFAELLEECSRLVSGEQIGVLLDVVERALSAIADTVVGESAPAQERDEYTRGLSWRHVKRKADEFRHVRSGISLPPVEKFRLHYADVGTPEDPKDRPPLFFRPHDGDDKSPYGFVRAPIVLRATRPRSVELRLEIRDDTDPLRKNWPTDGAWGSPKVHPETRSIREQEWHKEGEDYQVTLPLAVPIRRPSSANQSLRFTFCVRDGSAPECIAERLYEWDRLVIGEEGRPPLPELEWSNNEDPVYAKEVPVGPQVHVEEILGRVRAGNSLAITAPRRFGKSSLIALLEQRMQQWPDTISVRADCSSAASQDSSTIDHAELWRLVGRELNGATEGLALGSANDGQRPPLPTADAFQNLRRHAYRLGKARIVIFLDEAQRLFEAGPAFGARLRTLITTQLGRRIEGLAMVVFCFVGLPSITNTRLGEDLYPLLNPLVHGDLREEQVARVIKRVMGGHLFTTRAARDRIARSSWNLYALRTMLSRLRRYVRDDYRMWAGLEDVIAVEKALNDELHGGSDPESIATYVRDALNDGSTADAFQPIPAYPVAAAYALAIDDNLVGRGALEATVSTLDEWSTRIFRDQLSRPAYSQATVEKHLKVLEEQRVLENVKDVLGGYRFRSDFLRHYLVGKIPHLTYGDDVFREALLRGGSRTVRLPNDRTTVGRGAQAEVFRFKRDNAELAARVRELRSAEEQKAFLDSLVVLEKLRTIHTGNRDGAEGVYRLIEVGLLEDAGPTVKAVEVYDYVPGVDLGSKIGQLRAPIVVQLGVRLARSLALVHDHDVLHRDVRPQNIILQDHVVQPVLIDFGLACARSAPGGTPLDDEFTAPEVKGQTPQWSVAADVYALAMSLRRLLPVASSSQTQDDKELDRALRGLTTPDPKVRSDMGVLAHLLEERVTNLHLDLMQQELVNKLLKIVAGDPSEQDLRWSIKSGCALEVAGFALGLYSEPRDRLERVAFFVNKTAERIKGDSVSAWARNEYANARWPSGVSALVNLRNGWVHPREQRPTPTEQDVRQGVAKVAQWLETPSLNDVVGILLAT
jgi:serine/threonine protein kinase